MSIAKNYTRLKQEIYQIAKNCGRDPNDIKIIAVSKKRTIKDILEISQAGCFDFGESHVQELLKKNQLQPYEIFWHFIGSLQKNKVRKILNSVSLIHSVDSFELAKKISECSQEMNLKTPILLQVNTSGESSKHGMTMEECRQFFSQINNLQGIKVEGLMTIAPHTNEENIVRNCFIKLRLLKDEFKLPHLSMGMSQDYRIAIEEGATLLRIGRLIWE